MIAVRALLLLSVAGAISAQAPPEWIPASQIPGAVRSPCPGLNTYASFNIVSESLRLCHYRLANHGFLPRDGKSISILALDAACEGPHFFY